ncbi:unnamed protein product [Rotaria magnacalcarata]
MHFKVEAATQNTKPVQCYLCLKYNHAARITKIEKTIAEVANIISDDDTNIDSISDSDSDDDIKVLNNNKVKQQPKQSSVTTSQPLYSLISNVETHPTIGKISGHKPLAFNMPIGIESKPASPQLSLNFNTANWSKFRNKFNEQLMLWNKHRHITTSSDIEEYTTFITNSITTAIQKAIPT